MHAFKFEHQTWARVAGPGGERGVMLIPIETLSSLYGVL